MQLSYAFEIAPYQVLKTEQAPNTEIPDDYFALVKKEAMVTETAMPRRISNDAAHRHSSCVGTYEKIYREAMLGGVLPNDRLQQFLENDRKVRSVSRS